jgi:asparagine synthetase B (glutamine-hydrolysing)
MASSVETRVPFLDPDVVRLALNLPLEARVEPRRKGVLRDLGARLVGEDVATRPKVGFGFDAGRLIAERADPAFLREGRLRELLEIDAATWRAQLATPLPEGYALRAWSGEVWCRLVLDGASREDVEDELWRRPTG